MWSTSPSHTSLCRRLNEPRGVSWKQRIKFYPLVNVAGRKNKLLFANVAGRRNKLLFAKRIKFYPLANVTERNNNRPRWLSWMRRPTGDQEVAGSIPAEVGNILSWRLIVKYFLRSFSPFR